MKRFGFILVVTLIFCDVFGENSTFFSTVKNTTWKINEFYIDSNKVSNSTLDSFSFQFKENGEYIYSFGIRSFDSTYWHFDGSSQLIYINGAKLKDTLHLVYFDESNIIYKQRKINTVTKGFSWIETRLIPK